MWCMIYFSLNIADLFDLRFVFVLLITTYRKAKVPVSFYMVRLIRSEEPRMYLLNTSARTVGQGN
jgi:hypothetical protein